MSFRALLSLWGVRKLAQELRLSFTEIITTLQLDIGTEDTSKTSHSARLLRLVEHYRELQLNPTLSASPQLSALDAQL